MKAHEVRVVAESVMIDVRTPLPKVQKPTAGFEGKLANYGDNDVPRKDRHLWQRFSGQQSTNYGKDPPRTIAKYLSEDEFHTRTSLLKDGGACVTGDNFHPVHSHCWQSHTRLGHSNGGAD